MSLASCQFEMILWQLSTHPHMLWVEVEVEEVVGVVEVVVEVVEVVVLLVSKVH